MAKATTLRFSQFLILLGNGATPVEAFAKPCGLTSRGFERTANMNDTNVMDCDDEDAPSWLERDVISYQASISGAGSVANESFDTWDAWWADGGTKNVRIELGARVWEGPFKLAQLSVTGEKGQRVNMTISLVSDGEVPRVAP